MKTMKQVDQSSTTPRVRTLAAEGLDIAESHAIEMRVQKCIAQCIRVHRQNWRQGTVACKGRADVALSNKKPFKQKGTGRARAGSAKSPLWRKGGVTFGPQARVRTLAIPQAMRSLAMRTLLGNMLGKGLVRVIEYDVDHAQAPKTALFARTLEQAGLLGHKIAFLTVREDHHTHASCNNIEGVRLYLFDQINTYDLANADNIVFLARDQELFQKMVQTWI